MNNTSTPGRVVCLGEALVDFFCERPVASLGEADAFVPRPGGSLPNIAVCAARFGASVEIIGGAGDDEWGRWVKGRIAGEGVDVSRFALLQGVGTAHAFVAVDAAGEPSFAFYGDGERPAAHAAADLGPTLAGAGGVLVVGSDTLLGDVEREVTMRAAALASSRGWQVLCDPNLRPKRWPDRDAMVATIRDLIATSSVVKLNEAEAVELTGEDEVEAAGGALLGIGPDAVVVTRGERGALLVSAGGVEAVRAHDAQVVDATGAGDCVAGVLAAALAAGTAPVDLAGALPVAMKAAAGVVATWGAWDGLPGRTTASAEFSGHSPENPAVGH